MLKHVHAFWRQKNTECLQHRSDDDGDIKKLLELIKQTATFFIDNRIFRSTTIITTSITRSNHSHDTIKIQRVQLPHSRRTSLQYYRHQGHWDCQECPLFRCFRRLWLTQLLSVQCNSWHWTDIKSLECLCVCPQNVSSTIATTIFVRSS